MRIRSTLFFFFVFTLSLFSITSAQVQKFDVTLLDELEYAEDRVFVKFREGTSVQSMASIKETLNANMLQRYDFIDTELWQIRDISVKEAILQFHNHPDIEYIEPDLAIKLEKPVHVMEMNDGGSTGRDQTIPNDPFFNDLWGMYNTGQGGGTPGADIDATLAWNIETGDTILIAVFDSGIQYTHPDIAGNMWEGIGYDFADGNDNPWDVDGHGTHVAGTIAAVGNNGIGVTGVSWTAQLMAVKMFRNDGGSTTSYAVSGMQYAIANGAQISNHSWSVNAFIQTLFNAFSAARDAGQLAVAAAGNQNINNDTSHRYPANFNLDNIIAVAASDHQDNRASYSNYGPSTIHIAAPGGDHPPVQGMILSTYRNNGYIWMSGTSMAAPHVAGAASLVWSHYPEWDYSAVRTNILQSVDQLPQWENFVITGGRLNAYKALQVPDTIPPAPITDLEVIDAFYNTVHLRWTATGASADSGQADRYDIRYSTEPITEENFNDAVEVPNPPSPKLAGEIEDFAVENLNPNTQYYFAVKAADLWMNWSDISNVVDATTEGIPQIVLDKESFTMAIESGEIAFETLTISNPGEGRLLFVFPGAAPSGASPDLQTLYADEIFRFTDSDIGRTDYDFMIDDIHARLSVDSDTPEPFEGDYRGDVSLSAIGVIDSIYYDSGDDTADGFVGWGEPTPALYAATKFTVEDGPFFLTHIRNLYRTQTAQITLPVQIEIYAGGSNPDEGVLLTGQNFDGVTRNGMFFLIELDNPLWFEEGEVFWVVNRYQEGITHPQGFDENIPDVEGIYWYWSPGQEQWVDVGTAIPGAAYKTRALQAGYPWLLLDPVEGIVEAADAQEIDVTFDGTYLDAGLYSTTMILRSNDPDDPAIPIPVELAVDSLDMPDQVTLEYPADGGTVYIDDTGNIEIALVWKKAHPAIKHYEIEIATDAEFESVVFRFPTLTNTFLIYREVQDATTYWWRVRAGNQAGDGPFSDAWSFNTILTDVPDDDRGIPASYSLLQNYPNPFNPSTVIRYGLPERSRVTIEIYNTLGQRVETLLNSEFEAGYHDIEWYSGRVASGVYFYRIDAVSTDDPANRFVQVRSMVLVK